MNKFVLAFLTITILSGCDTIIKQVPVAVDKPYPACPKPPELPVYDLWVDNLTSADLNDPGKVGQAYKHDMMYLRQRIRDDQMVLDQYTQTSQQFEEVKKHIDDAYSKISNLPVK